MRQRRSWDLPLARREPRRQPARKKHGSVKSPAALASPQSVPPYLYIRQRTDLPRRDVFERVL